MGWTDEVFYAPLMRFIDQQRAPADAQAAVRFMHAISAYDWKLATAEIPALLKARENGIAWINEDLFRDGATIALLQTGEFAKARTVFDRMGAFAARKPGDLRVRLLNAHIAVREKAEGERSKAEK
jgi:hypothetical protein